MDFGARVRLALDEDDRTQLWLEKHSGVERTRLYRLLTGIRSDWTEREVRAVAHALRIPYDILTYGLTFPWQADVTATEVAA